MRVNTLMFGEIEVEDDKVITFNEGIPGFEHLKKFGIIETDEGGAFKHLQSLQDGDICFVIIDPYLLKKDYAPIINECYFEKLGGGENSEFVVYSIVCLKKPIEQSTVNLAGPLLIHTEHKLGVQVITEEKTYTTRHILDQLMQGGM